MKENGLTEDMVNAIAAKKRERKRPPAPPPPSVYVEQHARPKEVEQVQEEEEVEEVQEEEDELQSIMCDYPISPSGLVSPSLSYNFEI